MGRASAPTPAVAALERAGVAYRLQAYDHDARAPSYGLEAVEALGLDSSEVAKTLVADVEGVGLVVGVVPVDRQLDLKALAAAVGGKRARMADAEVAQRRTGYVLGGISPLGQRSRLATVVDEAAAAVPQLHVSAGRRGLEVALDPADLVRLTGAVVAPIAR